MPRFHRAICWASLELPWAQATSGGLLEPGATMIAFAYTSSLARSWAVVSTATDFLHALRSVLFNVRRRMSNSYHTGLLNLGICSVRFLFGILTVGFYLPGPFFFPGRSDEAF